MDIDELFKLVTVLPAEECEGVDFVVCGPTSFYDDDIHTTCAHCGVGVVHRPHAPVRPPKICMDCCDLQARADALPQA